jgi:hypothetical protein
MAKAPLDVRSLARQHTAAAIASLAGIATNGKSESARVAACDVLLQRGWGKPQASEGEHGEHIRVTIRKILETGVSVVEQRPSDEVLAIGARPNEAGRASDCE